MTGSSQPPIPTPTNAQLQQAQKNFHLHHYSDGRPWFFDLISQMFGNNGSGQVDTLDPSALHALQQGMYKRSAPAAPSAYYLGISHQVLYNGVHQGNAGQLGSIASAYSQSSVALVNGSQNDSTRALATSEMMWTGKSGDAARQAIATLVNQAGQAGQAAQVSAQLYQQQSTALQHAQTSIPKPPATPFNPAAAQQQLATITDPVQYAQQAAQDQAAFNAQQQAHQQAAAIVQTYDRTVTQTSQNQPGYAPPPVVAKHVASPTSGTTVPSGTGSGPGTSTPLHTPSTTGGRGTGSGTPGATGTGSGSTGASGFPGAGLPNPGAPGQTTTATYPGSGGAPSGTLPGGGFLPGSLGSGGDQSRTGQGPNASTGMDAGMLGPMGGGSMGGAGADIPRSGGGFGSGGGYGSGGAGGRTGGLPGGGQAGGESAARGGVGAAAAEEAAMESGAAGMRGAPGAGTGMVPGGGRGGRGGDDQEHKRASYLVEPDSDSVFGTDERTIPPVIGG